jgi:hypothetical protein
MLLKFSALLCFVGHTVPDVGKECAAITVRVKQYKNAF